MVKSALVLAQDLNEEGTDIGPRTVIRLTQALSHWHNTGEQLVVAAGMSPRHPDQPRLMAEMMHDWLMYHGCTRVAILHDAPQFSTVGELKAFFNPANRELVGQHSSIISAPWHLRRTRIQVKIFWGQERVDSMHWVEVLNNPMTLKDRIFEPIKTFFWWYTKDWSEEKRDKAWLAGIRAFDRVGINSSY